jgi:hypothetical protein
MFRVPAGVSVSQVEDHWMQWADSVGIASHVPSLGLCLLVLRMRLMGIQPLQVSYSTLTLRCMMVMLGRWEVADRMGGS